MSFLKGQVQSMTWYTEECTLKLQTIAGRKHLVETATNLVRKLFGFPLKMFILLF